MNKSELVVYVPNGIVNDLRYSLQLYPPQWITTSTKTVTVLDNFVFILSKVSFMQSREKYENHHLIPIKSTILKSEIGNNYRKYIDYLIKYKFIQTDGYYIVAKDNKQGKCYHFGFTKEYSDRKTEKFKISRRALINKMGIWKRIMEKSISEDPLMKNLYQSLKKISVDYPLIQEIIEEKVKTGELTQKKANIELNKAHKIYTNDMFLKSDKYGRVHTNVTNISKFIRNGFTLDREPITGIDIKSSQPALLFPLLHDKFNQIIKNSQFGEVNKLRIQFKSQNSFDDITLNYSDFGYSKLSKFKTDFSMELNKYKKILKSGIYEQFTIWWNSYFNEDVARKDMKKQWFYFAFGKNDRKMTKIMKIWKMEFPLITKMITFVKKDDHALLAKALQKIESRIVLKEICTELFKLKIDVVTVHDSVYIKSKMLKKVLPIFTKMLKKYNVVSGISVE